MAALMELTPSWMRGGEDSGRPLPTPRPSDLTGLSIPMEAASWSPECALMV